MDDDVSLNNSHNQKYIDSEYYNDDIEEVFIY